MINVLSQITHEELGREELGSGLIIGTFANKLHRLTVDQSSTNRLSDFQHSNFAFHVLSG